MLYLPGTSCIIYFVFVYYSFMITMTTGMLSLSFPSILSSTLLVIVFTAETIDWCSLGRGLVISEVSEEEQSIATTSNRFYLRASFIPLCNYN